MILTKKHLYVGILAGKIHALLASFFFVWL